MLAPTPTVIVFNFTRELERGEHASCQDGNLIAGAGSQQHGELIATETGDGVDHPGRC